MRFIKQTIMSDPNQANKGNCVQACVASLLDMDLELVPNFIEVAKSPNEWEIPFREFLKIVGFHTVNYSGEWVFPGLYLAIGFTKRNNGEITHMCIMRDGDLVHDPHPDNTGLTQVKHVKLLVPFEPKVYLNGLSR